MRTIHRFPEYHLFSNKHHGNPDNGSDWEAKEQYKTNDTY